MSDVKRGGSTLFPLSSHAGCSSTKNSSIIAADHELLTTFSIGARSWERDMMETCHTGCLAVKPKRGDAVLFYSQTSWGGLDVSSAHGTSCKKTIADATIEANNNVITGGCPVLEGTKWAANLVSRSNQQPKYLFMNVLSGFGTVLGGDSLVHHARRARRREKKCR